MTKYLLAVIITIHLCGSIEAQQRKTFGDVSKQELEMKFYEKDSSANAVILYDYGHFDNATFNFTRHIRIKILNKSGTRWGNWTLNVPSKSAFKAFVFNQNGDVVTKEKLEKSSIFQEEVVDGMFVYKVFLPNVKEGSVIDLQYYFEGIPYEWRFQELIPTAYSELEIEKLSYLNLQRRYFGFVPIEEIEPNHWLITDIPAFKEEPFLNHYTNYIARLQFDFTSINESWQKISKHLLNSWVFGEVIRKGNSYINEKAKEINSTQTSDLAKIHSAYDFIKNNVKWNGVYSKYSGYRHQEIYKKGLTANSGEINLQLISLLKKIGIAVWPVVLSTRDNGLIMQFSPSIRRLNYVVAYVRLGDDEILLDATEKNLIPGVLPERCLNGQGWIVDEAGGGWIDLIGTNKSSTRHFTQISMSDQGQWIANVGISNVNYAYLKWKQEFDKKSNEIEHWRSVEEAFGGLVINEYEVKKIDPPNLQVQESMTVNIVDYVDDLGYELLIDPFFISRNIKENPFKSDTRLFPVDLAYPSDYKSTILITIPDEYKLKSMPETYSMSLPNNDAIFHLDVRNMDRMIQIQVNLKINKTLFTETEYPILKNFYSMMINQLNQPVYLTKTI